MASPIFLNFSQRQSTRCHCADMRRGNDGRAVLISALHTKSEVTIAGRQYEANDIAMAI